MKISRYDSLLTISCADWEEEYFIIYSMVNSRILVFFIIFFYFYYFFNYNYYIKGSILMG